MRSQLLVLGLGAFVGAVTNTSECCNVDPTTVDVNIRLSWCRAQTNTCPLLCSNGNVDNNTCDSTTLQFSCLCESGQTPNVSDYGQTLPSLECEEWVSQCVTAHPNDLPGLTFCRSFMCGSQNASSAGAGATTTSSVASTAASTNSASSSVASASHTGAATKMLVNVGKEAGTGAIAVGLMALFGLAL